MVFGLKSTRTKLGRRYCNDCRGKVTMLFPGRTGPHLTDLKGPWAKICQMAGLPGIRIHDLRHSFASHLVSSGISLPIVGKLLGHTQQQTTARYSHLADDPQREAANRFPV